MATPKEPIKLRRRATSNGRISLYLDIYSGGYRRYEYLRLYLIPEKNRADKEKNRQTEALAEAIRAKRVVELRNQEYGFRDEHTSEVRFYDYYRAMVEKRRGEQSQSNWGNWRSALNYLLKYEPNQRITFRAITPKWVEGFKNYLERDAMAWSNDGRERTDRHRLSRNSQLSYFNKLRACLNQAFEEGIIRTNPIRGVEPIHGEEGTRMYLTLDEIRKLAQTPCEYPNIRRAFLFSCLTGLRRSDVQQLCWGDVQQQGEYTRLIFRQKKTKGQEYLDITPQAAELMGKRGRDDESVFSDIHSPSCTNNTIKRWVLRAGINKEITFHCSRHSRFSFLLKHSALQNISA